MKEFIVSNVYIWMFIAIMPWGLLVRPSTVGIDVTYFLIAIQSMGLFFLITSYILDK